MWNVICCMVSSLILLIESEYTVFIVFRYHVITIWRPNCVNPSVFIVFRCLFRYPAILRSPCDRKISTSTNWVLSDRVSDIFIYIYIYIYRLSLTRLYWETTLMKKLLDHFIGHRMLHYFSNSVRPTL